MRFSGKTVVVSGGNSGIGLRAAERFAQEGAKVVIIGRNPATLEEARSAIGKDAIALKADLGVIADVRQACRQVVEEFGHVDVIFANAGMSAVAAFEDITEADYDRIMNVNLKGTFFLLQGLLPAMDRGGTIVVCGSMVASRAFAKASTYCSSKAALRSLVGVLGQELGERGIRINTLTPGYIETPIYSRIDGMTEEMTSQLASASIAATPLKRAGTTDDCASAVLYLASDDASFVTGSEIVVDGGVVGPL